MRYEPEQETIFSISLQEDYLLAGKQEPGHRGEGEERQVDVSFLQVLEALLCTRPASRQAWQGAGDGSQGCESQLSEEAESQ